MFSAGPVQWPCELPEHHCCYGNTTHQEGKLDAETVGDRCKGLCKQAKDQEMAEDTLFLQDFNSCLKARALNALSRSSGPLSAWECPQPFCQTWEERCSPAGDGDGHPAWVGGGGPGRNQHSREGEMAGQASTSTTPRNKNKQQDRWKRKEKNEN